MPEAVPIAGTVRRLRRYPVKGLAGEDLTEVFVSYAGIVGDRVYAFTDPQNQTHFPWMTARVWEGMILLQARFVRPPSAALERPGPSAFAVEVLTPRGERYAVEDPRFHEYLEEEFGRPLEFRFSERCMHDARPLSLISVQTLAALSIETNLQLDPRRFRPNLIVEWDVEGSFVEDSLVGKRVRIGEVVEIVIVKKDGRCKVITLDPDTAEASPVVLETVARRHDGYAGVYAAVLREGIVRPGDRVSVD